MALNRLYILWSFIRDAIITSKKNSLLELLVKEDIDNDALQIELNRILAKGKAVKQIKMVDSLLHRAKRTSENILIGNKIIPEIFEE